MRAFLAKPLAFAQWRSVIIVTKAIAVIVSKHWCIVNALLVPSSYFHPSVLMLRHDYILHPGVVYLVSMVARPRKVCCVNKL